jgi:hypothetical protein
MLVRQTLFSTISFKEVVAKYKLDAPEKADEISHLLTGDAQQVSVDDFAQKYDMEVADAHTFLSFIQVRLSLCLVIANLHSGWRAI